MSDGPWDHRMKDRGLYQLRFNGDVKAEVMWTQAPDMASTLVREMCAGMNDGYRARHPESAPSERPEQVPADPTPPQWGEVLNTVEATAAWVARVHAVDKRTYWNGAGLAHQAYLDEVTGRPDIPRDAAA